MWQNAVDLSKLLKRRVKDFGNVFRGLVNRVARLTHDDPGIKHAFHKVKVKAPIENIPPELRLQILMSLDLCQLRALVHASPVFHQDYRLSRRFVLPQCLSRTLGPTASDAYGVYLASPTRLTCAGTYSDISKFLEAYQILREGARVSHGRHRLQEDEAISISAFYHSTVRPVADRYVTWALMNLAEQTKGSLDRAPLSGSEGNRVLRALYRFQLCCNLFGLARVTKLDDSFQLWPRFDGLDILKLFLCLFEPWEVEEIACFYVFAKQWCDRTFTRICWDVHKENPKFNGQFPPTPDGAFDWDNEMDRECFLIGTISQGLGLLKFISSEGSNHAEIVSTMQARIQRLASGFLEDEAFGETTQSQLRQEHLTDREQRQERRDPMPFEGDGDSESEGPRPPLAWILMWGGVYSNLFGQYIDDATHRWGYVMWDADRLDRTGGSDLVLRQCKEQWADEDPRDYLFY